MTTNSSKFTSSLQTATKRVTTTADQGAGVHSGFGPLNCVPSPDTLGWEPSSSFRAASSRAKRVQLQGTLGHNEPREMIKLVSVAGACCCCGLHSRKQPPCRSFALKKNATFYIKHLPVQATRTPSVATFRLTKCFCATSCVYVHGAHQDISLTAFVVRHHLVLCSSRPPSRLQVGVLDCRRVCACFVFGSSIIMGASVQDAFRCHG